jgi:hypothetical protein
MPTNIPPEMAAKTPATVMKNRPRTWNQATSKAGTLFASQSAIGRRPMIKAGAMHTWMIPTMSIAVGDMMRSLELRART